MKPHRKKDAESIETFIKIYMSCNEEKKSEEKKTININNTTEVNSNVNLKKTITVFIPTTTMTKKPSFSNLKMQQNETKRNDFKYKSKCYGKKG